MNVAQRCMDLDLWEHDLISFNGMIGDLLLEKGVKSALGSSCLSLVPCLYIRRDHNPFPMSLRRIKVATCNVKILIRYPSVGLLPAGSSGFVRKSGDKEIW